MKPLLIDKKHKYDTVFPWTIGAKHPLSPLLPCIFSFSFRHSTVDADWEGEAEGGCIGSTRNREMADARRWNVTYTRHLKQKRKVYHDGFLVLLSSTNKVSMICSLLQSSMAYVVPDPSFNFHETYLLYLSIHWHAYSFYRATRGHRFTGHAL